MIHESVSGRRDCRRRWWRVRRSLRSPRRPKAARAPGGELKDLKQKASYSYGYSLGRNLKAQKVELDAELIARGIADALGGGAAALNDAEIQSCLQEFSKQLQARQAGMAGKAATGNKVEGEKFLAENKDKPGVTTLPSGLQYKVVKQGTGPKPTATDTVTVHYEGKLIDGTVFDSSLKRGEPASFPVNRRDPRLDRGPPAHAGRLDLAALHPQQPRLWRAPPPRRADRAQCRADLRGPVDQDRRVGSRSSANAGGSAAWLVTRMNSDVPGVSYDDSTVSSRASLAIQETAGGDARAPPRFPPRCRRGD